MNDVNDIKKFTKAKAQREIATLSKSGMPPEVVYAAIARFADHGSSHIKKYAAHRLAALNAENAIENAP